MTRRILPALLLASAAATAQNALWIDLSGEWRALAAQDRPEFAATDFDDSKWKPYLLPSDAEDLPARLWLRRVAVLPDGVDRTQLALMLGTVNSAYEVFANGVRIGDTGGLTRRQYRIPRPLTFDIPGNVLPPGENRLTIAIRSVSLGQRKGSIWGIEPTGPFRITYQRHTPRDEGARHINDRRVRDLLYVAISVAFLGLAALMFLAWVSETKQRHIFWFALCLALEGSRLLLRFLMISEHSFPLRWLPLEQLISSLFSAGFTYFVALALGFRQGWIRTGIWMVWCAYPLSLLIDDSGGWFAPVSRLLSVIAICLTGAGWWRQGRTRQAASQHGFAVALFLTAFLRLNSIRGSLGLPGGWAFGPYRISSSSLAFFILAVMIAVQILRWLAADRRESQRLAAEMEAGRGVQQLLLTGASNTYGEFLVEAVYEPAQELGGDFHWNRSAPDGSLTVVVGDVSGKGLKAAMLVSVAVGILRTQKSQSPAAILSTLNEGLAGNAGGGFVTCCCARFEPDGRVTIANAGHPAPYCDGREMEVEAGLPLGITSGLTYAESASEGERFTFVSDGVVEADSNGELFGFDRTREISRQPAREIADAAKAWGQNDDITVLTVRRVS